MDWNKIMEEIESDIEARNIMLELKTGQTANRRSAALAVKLVARLSDKANRDVKILVAMILVQISISVGKPLSTQLIAKAQSLLS